jgi:hypothetical protein
MPAFIIYIYIYIYIHTHTHEDWTEACGFWSRMASGLRNRLADEAEVRPKPKLGGGRCNRWPTRGPRPVSPLFFFWANPISLGVPPYLAIGLGPRLIDGRIPPACVGSWLLRLRSSRRPSCSCRFKACESWTLGARFCRRAREGADHRKPHAPATD